MSATRVALLDYGSGNLRSAQRALERVGATVEVTSEPKTVLAADGLLVPGVGAFAACMSGLKAVQGDRMIGERLAGGRPVFGICVGMQILFEWGNEYSSESGEPTPGCGEWPGTVEILPTSVLPHIGWNTVNYPEGSALFSGMDPEDRYYFVHSYGVQNWELETDGHTEAPLVTWARHENTPFVAAVENGPLWATQFHPEKSGDAGATLLENWVRTMK